MKATQEAIDRVGSAELARLLACSKQLVSHWRVGRLRVSAERAVEIETVTEGRILKSELRPDLWPTPPIEQRTGQRRATDHHQAKEDAA
jgi:DNA-binding transcriptional regulator YdaS (Cro superfamily)